MREEHPNISHQIDIWHVCKNICKQFSKATKKKSKSILNKWIKSVRNHFWCSCAICSGCEHALREKWTSILFHIQNKHNWLGSRFFHDCTHRIGEEEPADKEWLDTSSDSFKALQTFIFDKSLINDMKHLTGFSHTGSLEVYHSLLNKWVLKSTHFLYEGMIVQSQLAVYFNLGSNLE